MLPLFLLCLKGVERLDGAGADGQERQLAAQAASTSCWCDARRPAGARRHGLRRRRAVGVAAAKAGERVLRRRAVDEKASAARRSVHRRRMAATACADLCAERRCESCAARPATARS